MKLEQIIRFCMSCGIIAKSTVGITKIAMYKIDDVAKNVRY